MGAPYPGRTSRVTSIVLVLWLFAMAMSLSGCGGDIPAQQQASQKQTQLNVLLRHAQQRKENNKR